MERSAMLLIGKPSISMGHGFHVYVKQPEGISYIIYHISYIIYIIYIIYIYHISIHLICANYFLRGVLCCEFRHHLDQALAEAALAVRWFQVLHPSPEARPPRGDIDPLRGVRMFIIYL